MTLPIADPLAQAFHTEEPETTLRNSWSPSNLRIGNRVRTRRISCGISKKELSEQLEIDQSDLDRYETGAKRVNAKLLFRIAKLLDVRPDYFFQDYAEGAYEPA
ncbi:MAG TPA: helix-turn-helix transcriptional regulator [Candidatus Binataceae bacterium]|nr:helix-turn-helix transcriptional regulator [Candidatus Binataceae bacterium]